MRLNKLIEKIERYTKKELSFSEREYKQLQSLREDVEHIREAVVHGGKWKQAALIDHYKEHAKRIARYSERIERRLNVWIKRLGRLLALEEAEINQDLPSRDRARYIQYFNSYMEHLRVIQSRLINLLSRGGQLHKLLEEPFPKWEQVEKVILEAIGNNRSPGIRSLVSMLGQLEAREKEIDSKIITKSKSKFGAYRDSAFRFLKEIIKKNKGYFVGKLAGKNLIDLGSGEYAYYNYGDLIEALSGEELEKLFEAHSSGRIDEKEFQKQYQILRRYAPKKVFFVDPFHHPTATSSSESREYFEEKAKKGKLEYFKMDGLSFLNKSNIKGNILTSHITHDVIGSLDYLERLAYAIYRTVPAGGIFISVSSHALENVAERLFRKRIDFGMVAVFEK